MQFIAKISIYFFSQEPHFFATLGKLFGYFYFLTVIKPNKLRLHFSSVTSYFECLHFKDPHFTKDIWAALTTIKNSFGSRKQQKIIFIHGLWHSASWHSFLNYEQTIWSPKQRRLFGTQLGAERFRLDPRPLGLDAIYRIWKQLCIAHSFSFWKSPQDISWFVQLGSDFSE